MFWRFQWVVLHFLYHFYAIHLKFAESTSLKFFFQHMKLNENCRSFFFVSRIANIGNNRNKLSDTVCRPPPPPQKKKKKNLPF